MYLCFAKDNMLAESCRDFPGSFFELLIRFHIWKNRLEKNWVELMRIKCINHEFFNYTGNCRKFEIENHDAELIVESVKNQLMDNATIQT